MKYTDLSAEDKKAVAAFLSVVEPNLSVAEALDGDDSEVDVLVSALRAAHATYAQITPPVPSPAPVAPPASVAPPAMKPPTPFPAVEVVPEEAAAGSGQVLANPPEPQTDRRSLSAAVTPAWR